jgi:hypothetical protein
MVSNLNTLHFPKASLHTYETLLPTSNVNRKLVLDGNSAWYAYNDASVNVNFRFDTTEYDILFQKALAADATNSYLQCELLFIQMHTLVAEMCGVKRTC